MMINRIFGLFKKKESYITIVLLWFVMLLMLPFLKAGILESEMAYQLTVSDLRVTFIGAYILFLSLAIVGKEDVFRIKNTRFISYLKSKHAQKLIEKDLDCIKRIEEIEKSKDEALSRLNYAIFMLCDNLNNIGGSFLYRKNKDIENQDEEIKEIINHVTVARQTLSCVIQLNSQSVMNDELYQKYMSYIEEKLPEMLHGEFDSEKFSKALEELDVNSFDNLRIHRPTILKDLNDGYLPRKKAKN